MSDHNLLAIIAVAAVWVVVCASFAAYHLAGIHDMLVKPFLQPSSSMKDDDDLEDEDLGKP
jgi:hypothetical protein